MNYDRAFRHDLARHSAANLDGFHLDAPEEMHVRFAIDHDVVSDQPAGNFSDVIDGRGPEAIHVAAHLSFDHRRATSHGGAAEIAFRRDMDLALGLDRTTEACGDFVIPQIDVGTALRAETRRRRGTDLVLRLALEAFDFGIVVFVPKPFDLLQKRRIARARGRFDALFFRPEPDLVLRRRGREVRAALAAHRAFGGDVLRLLEAAVWTFHTEFCRRRLGGHWRLGRKVTVLDSSPESRFRRLRRFFVPDDLRTRRRSGGLARPAAGHFGFADKGRAFFDDETRRLQVALQRATGLQLAAFRHRDVALHLAVNRDRFRLDLTIDVGVFADGENAVGIDLALNLSVDEELLLEFDGAFDLDVARENVFARMFSHIFFWIDCWCCPWFFSGGAIILLSARA